MAGDPVAMRSLYGWLTGPAGPRHRRRRSIREEMPQVIS